VCDREVVAGSVHYCQAQEILNATGENEIILKVSFRGSKDFMWLVAAYHRYGYEVSINFQEEILRDALLENPGDEEIKTVDLWRAPSASERERTAEISELKQELARIEVERSVPGRVEGAFKTGPERQGKAQLRFEGPFTGQVQNRHAEGGWSTYKNQPVLFVCHDNCHWLNEQPAAGQAWLCTVGFQIAFVGNMPVIVVKPAVRTDGEQAIRARLAELESGLGEMKTASMREVAATGNGVFTEAGKRDFHCAACGATNTLTRGEYAEYRDGNPVTIICINCEASGVVQRKS
ncbi:MAG: hypothetical protein HYV78_02525, partial [Candidatus Wildermuthbacteria bacterium]|nr:hypothetical protein [Candidatus Wildermuthbacteria bacterium]